MPHRLCLKLKRRSCRAYPIVCSVPNVSSRGKSAQGFVQSSICQCACAPDYIVLATHPNRFAVLRCCCIVSCGTPPRRIHLEWCDAIVHRYRWSAGGGLWFYYGRCFPPL